MPLEFLARRGLISLSTSSFYGPINFGVSSSIVGVPTGSVLFTGGSGNITGSSNLYWDNVNNRLGVNTTTPTAGMQINGANDLLFLNGAGARTTLKLGALSSGYTEVVGNGTNFYFTTTTNTNISFITNNVDRFRVFGSTGNILIQSGGTFTDSNYRLDANGTGATTGALRVTGGNVQFGTQFLWDNTNQNLALGSNTTTTGNRIYFNYSGTYGGDFTSQLAGVEQLSFGFNNSNFFGGGSNGVNSGRTLYFFDRITSAYYGGYSAINGWYFGQSSTRYGLRIENPNASIVAMTLKSDGKIGINQTAPTALFDVDASTTSRASLRIRSGTAPTTPNDGDIWYDGTNLKMQIGGVTKTFTMTP